MKREFQHQTGGRPRVQLRALISIIQNEEVFALITDETEADRIASLIAQTNVIELPGHSLDPLWYKRLAKELVIEARKVFRDQIPKTPGVFEEYTATNLDVIRDSVDEIASKLNQPSPIAVTVKDIADSFKNASTALRNYKSQIGDVHIMREETREILNWATTTGSNQKLLLVEDLPGRGKSVVLKDVLDELEKAQVHVLAIKADSLSSVSSSEPSDNFLHLPASPEKCIRELADKSRVVVIVDQLDALSLTLTKDSGALNRLLGLIGQITANDQVKCIVSCRTFDRHHDPRLQNLSPQKTVQISLLTHEQVQSVLDTLRIPLSSAPASLQQLLTVPLNLDIFYRVSKGREGTPNLNYTKRQDLFDGLWERVFNIEAQLAGIEHLTHCIDKIVDRMHASQSTSVPAAILDDHPTQLTFLRKWNVLVEQESRLSLFHQTFFDYCYARRFVADDRNLSEQLLSGEQGLFERSVVIAVMEHLRSANPAVYTAQLATLLFSDELRTHLRLLLMDWLASVPSPSPDEVIVATRLLGEQSRGAEFLRAVRNSPQWFLPIRSSLEHIWLQPADPARLHHAFWYLQSAIAGSPREVVDLLSSYYANCRLNHVEILNCLSQLQDWNLEEAQGLYRAIQNTDIDAHSILYAIDRMAKSAPIFAMNALMQCLKSRLEPSEDDDVEAKLFSDYFVGNAVKTALSTNLRESLPVVLLGFVEISQNIGKSRFREPWATFLFHSDGQLDTHWYDDHILRTLTSIFEIQNGVRQIARSSPALFRTLYAQIASSQALLAHRLIVSGFIQDSEEFVRDIYEYFRTNDKCFFVGEHASDFSCESRALLAQVFPHFEEDKKTYIEKKINEICAAFREDDSGRARFAELQFLFLIGEQHLTANGRRRLIELKNRFPDYKGTDVPRIRGGSVGSPIPPNKFDKMTDSDWLNAMRKYDDSHDPHAGPWKFSEEGLIRGGKDELARALTSFVSTSPNRFAGLAQQFDSSISDAYRSAITRGLSKLDDATPFIDLFLKFAPTIDEEYHRELCWAVNDKAEALLPESILDVLIDWSFKDRNPELGQPDTDGMNCNRGVAIYAITNVLLNQQPRAVDRLFSLFDQWTKDPVSAVLQSVIDNIKYMVRHDVNKSIEIAHECIKAFPTLITDRRTHNFLSVAIRGSKQPNKTLIDLVNACLGNSDNATQTAGATLLTLASFKFSDFRKAATDILGDNESKKTGCAKVYATNVDDALVGSLCKERLLELVLDPSDKVREEVAKCFHHLKPERSTQDVHFVNAMIDKLPPREIQENVTDYLTRVAHLEHEVSLMAAQKILDHSGDTIADMRHRNFGLQDDIVSIALTVYRYSTDPIIKRRAMDLFERILVLGSYHANQALGEWDRK